MVEDRNKRRKKKWLGTVGSAIEFLTGNIDVAGNQIISKILSEKKNYQVILQDQIKNVYSTNIII